VGNHPGLPGPMPRTQALLPRFFVEGSIVLARRRRLARRCSGCCLPRGRGWEEILVLMDRLKHLPLIPRKLPHEVYHRPRRPLNADAVGVDATSQRWGHVAKGRRRSATVPEPTLLAIGLEILLESMSDTDGGASR
jgi:hypothetical protein